MNAARRLEIIARAAGEPQPHHREAFLLYAVCNLSLDEVRREMRISERRARIYVARAMMYIQNRLDDDETAALTEISSY